MDSVEVRPPAVAGQFYEADPKRLRDGIEKLLAEIPPRKGEGKLVRAVVMPHAGYVYSGPTAVKTLAQARGASYKRALVIAPSHRVGFEGLATAPYKALKTPLGDIPVDLESVELLRKSDSPYIREMLQAHAREHALEVELPILQALLPSMPVVPLICGQLSIEAARAIARELAPLWNRETLWMISSDFTHFGQSFGYIPFASNVQERLRDLDLGAVEEAASLDLEGFDSYVKRTGATICGESPIKVLLAAASAALAAGEPISGRLADYSNSGESTRDWSHCVGYAGIVFEESL